MRVDRKGFPSLQWVVASALRQEYPGEAVSCGAGEMPGKLDDSEISARLAALPAWELRDGKLRREFRFRDFSDAFAFMTRVAMLAERYDHHPDWSNVYDRVTIELWSHDAGGITERDVVLAREISRVRDSR